EHGDGDRPERDQCVDEVAVEEPAPVDREAELGEVVLPKDRGDQRRDQVGDERRDERAEGDADDEGHRQLDEVAAQEESSELLGHGMHSGSFLYSPEKDGDRFSRKAAKPSRMSAVDARRTRASVSRAIASSTASPSPSTSSRFVARTASGAREAISSASALVLASRCTGSTTAFSSPLSKASSAPISRPVSISSDA